MSATYSGEKRLQSNHFLEVSKVAKENKKEGKQRDSDKATVGK